MSRSPIPSRLRVGFTALATAALLAGLVPATTSASAATVLGAAASVPVVVPATPSAAAVKLTVVASGLSDPVLLTAPNDGTNRLFIVEKTGVIRVVSGGTLLTTPFLTMRKSVSTGSEQGLLGLAFHPAYKTNRKFYVDYTDVNGNTVIREYKASATNKNVVQSGSGRTILAIKQPFSNHNGGNIAFGQDGYLYIGMGDGGSGGDPGNRAQNVNTLLGKMLRIDINGTSGSRPYRIPSTNPYVGKTGLDQIWQIGLRNPWRFSFDKVTGNLWIGDVGQDRYEEVDRAVKTSTGAGRGYNWGWHAMEGFHCYSPSSGCRTSGKRLPLLEYSHSTNSRCAITGGYVYRGTKIPMLRGWYVFGDYCSGEVLAVSSTATSKPAPVTLFGTGSGRMVSSFGQDAAGELYVVDLGGTVYRIDPA